MFVVWCCVGLCVFRFVSCMSLSLCLCVCVVVLGLVLMCGMWFCMFRGVLGVCVVLRCVVFDLWCSVCCLVVCSGGCCGVCCVDVRCCWLLIVVAGVVVVVCVSVVWLL